MNRRSLPRRKKRISCTLEVGGRLHTGIAADFSESGLFVQTALNPPPDEDILIRLPGNDGQSEIVLRTRLVRIRKVPPRLAAVVQRGIAVRIVSAPGSYRALACGDTEDALVFDDEEELSREEEPFEPGTATEVKLPIHEPAPPADPEPETKTEPETETGTETRVYRARVSMPGSPRTRAMTVEASSEQAAAYQLHGELGPEWKVESLERRDKGDPPDPRVRDRKD